MQFAKAKTHFIGIGGVGMCGLAELLHNMGAQVTGSDLQINANAERLRSLGIVVHLGHHAENIQDVDVVVYSSAVKSDNPEILAAREKKIPIIPRAEALAEIMRLKRGVAVGGTHGKTTTTSMIASIFLAAQLDPTIVVGGRLDLIKSTALLGQGEWLIAEADESDGSFLKLSPELVVITNIDDDHMDYYKTADRLEAAYLDFALRIPFFGAAIVCGDDPRVQKIFKSFPKKIIFYGFDRANDYFLEGKNSNYSIFHRGEWLGEFELQVPGRHNALNALASICIARTAGIDFASCKKGLFEFSGVNRRFQHKGEYQGAPIYDDYAHHPTEIRATLQAFREKFPDKKIVVGFQPHRYSRTQICWKDFCACFNQADQIFICDIYAAGEAPITGIDAQKLAKEIKHAQCSYVGSIAQAETVIKKHLNEQSVFVTLGAGDIWKLGAHLCGNSK